MKFFHKCFFGSKHMTICLSSELHNNNNSYYLLNIYYWTDTNKDLKCIPNLILIVPLREILDLSPLYRGEKIKAQTLYNLFTLVLLHFVIQKLDSFMTNYKIQTLTF